MRRALLFLFAVICLIYFSPTAFARDNVDYWYIENFESKIIVNKDSSLDITELITADCGSAQKHGIFRVLPTKKQMTNASSISMPIKLISITDFNDKPYKYTTTNDTIKNTVTWKIGDADVFVSGVNYYKIHYKVKNAVLHNSQDFDELYWNLSGNFWDIPIDQFKARITLPDGIEQSNSGMSFYSGEFGDANTLKSTGDFTDKNQIDVSVAQTMEAGQGITISLAFPKNIISPYVPTAWEKYGKYLFALIPVIVLFFSYKLWKKYGKDPSINPTVAPEFEIPEKLCPIDMGLVYTDGSLKNNFISASIINLAVNKHIKIKKIEKKGMFSKEDFELIRLSGGKKLAATEEFLLEKLMGSNASVKISSLKDKFYKNIPKISDKSSEYLSEKKWLVSSSRTWQGCFCGCAVGFVFLAIMLRAISSTGLLIPLIISGLVVFAFSFLMRSRTKGGAELNRRIKGFKLYMDTAEKYRQKFNEKENIFEKFLPYAIMFGITKEWVKKMKDIYGAEYFNTYHPIWFIGPNFDSFNIDSIATEISSMSSSMSSTITSSPSSSGSGGGGFSGGGGGGGGGGGW